MLPIAIIAGGLGTRLGAISENIPKALVPVCGRPFIDYQLALLKQNGITEVVLCVGYLGELIEAHVGNGSAYGLSVRYAYDGPSRIGTGGALKNALPMLGERFFSTFGDSYLRCDYRAIAKAFIASRKLGLMTVYRNNGALAPSNVLFESNQIRAYDKRNPSAKMQYIDFGLSVFDSSAFQQLPVGISVDLTVVNVDLIARDELAGYEAHDRFYEVGTPQGIADLELFLRSV